MNAFNRYLTVGGLVLGLSVPAVAQEVSRAEVEALRAEISQLRAQQSQQTDSWMNARRAEQVRQIVQEVLADTDTRASLLQEGMYAGHNGSKFFLQSADGGFLMEIDGQIQLRYIYNVRGGDLTDEGDDGDSSGFELRRSKIQFSGHIADPRLQYAIQLAVHPADNVVEADKIIIGYQLTESIYVWGGEDKGPFTREEMTSSKYQLAVERSYVQEFFTLDKVQGIGMVWQDPSILDDMLRGHLVVSDGLRSGDGSTSVNPFTQEDDFNAQDEDRETSKRFHEDASDFAITGRLDVRLTGEWSQMRDFTSFPGEDFAAFVGGAFHYEVGRTGDAFLNNDFFMWTIDGSVESNGLSAFAAIYGMHTDNETDVAGVQDFDLLSFVIQGAYNIAMGDDSVEPFIRYEYIDFDDAITDFGINTEDKVSMLTFGANYYLNRHAAKFTLDLVWAFDPVPFGATGAGILADTSDEEDQVVVRSQFQLLF